MTHPIRYARVGTYGRTYTRTGAVGASAIFALFHHRRQRLGRGARKLDCRRYDEIESRHCQTPPCQLDRPAAVIQPPAEPPTSTTTDIPIVRGALASSTCIIWFGPRTLVRHGCCGPIDSRDLLCHLLVLPLPRLLGAVLLVRVLVCALLRAS
eukprot:SAG31_NODE_16318_length_714_cov_1.817590_1_plen_152_part_01